MRRRCRRAVCEISLCRFAANLATQTGGIALTALQRSFGCLVGEQAKKCRAFFIIRLEGAQLGTLCRPGFARLAAFASPLSHSLSPRTSLPLSRPRKGELAQHRASAAAATDAMASSPLRPSACQSARSARQTTAQAAVIARPETQRVAHLALPTRRLYVFVWRRIELTRAEMNITRSQLPCRHLFSPSRCLFRRTSSPSPSSSPFLCEG